MVLTEGEARNRIRAPSTRTFAKKVDAQRWLRDEFGRIDVGTWVDAPAGDLTFEEFFTSWAEHQVWMTNTEVAMSLAVRSTPFRAMPLRAIRTTHVETWIKSMTVATGDRKRRWRRERSRPGS